MEPASKRNLYILFCLWAAVQAYLLLSNGIKIDGEAARVIKAADSLVTNGHFASSNSYMYFTEIFLIYITIKLGIGFWLIILIQLLLNGTALFCLYKFMANCYSSQRLALIGCALLILCYPYQLYNSFLYTESIFFSLSIIYSCLLLKSDNFTSKRITLLLLLLLLLCITRPSGIFIFAASIIYIYFRLPWHISQGKRILIFLCLGAIGLVVLNIMMGSGGGIDIILPFKDERVICDVPTLGYDVNIKVNSNGNSIYGLFYYVTHNSSQFWRLSLLKSKAFFGLTRPYYSFGHNLFITVFFYTLYTFIISGLLKFKRQLPVSFIYFISLILIFWLSVVFSCDEWHNRFFLTLTPFLIIPALYLFSKKPNLK